ncbi:MAG TPA: hypothetical protein VMT45_14290 [Thermoanaerobaculaceae bacterium]|nr:hypothetical protein [Thermoanaerobaculaceae bacterium]
MSLADFANLAQVVGALVVILGVAFAVVQVKEISRQRRETAAIQLANSFGSRHFAQAFRQVLDLPPGAEAAEVKRCGIEDAAMLVSLTIESVAIMVHREIIDIDMVWELMGGVVLSTWDRLRDWSDSYRRASGREKFDEWYQWLAARLEENYSGPKAEPAFRRFARWQPPPR